MKRAAHEHDLSEAELVERARRGGPSAFAELVSRYQDRIFNTCYRMCHNHADALDLTQTTFLKALEALPRFQRHASFYTWIFRIAINLALSQRRRQARRPVLSLDRPTADPDETGPEVADPREGDVSAPVQRDELHGRVERALAQLDEEFRAAVVLKDIEDLDYAAIAEILNVPVGTVKSRIHRGRLMLRDLLIAERADLDRP